MPELTLKDRMPGCAAGFMLAAWILAPGGAAAAAAQSMQRQDLEIGAQRVAPRVDVEDLAECAAVDQPVQPQHLRPQEHRRLRQEPAVAACGCRDYSRIDFMLSNDGELYLL